MIRILNGEAAEMTAEEEGRYARLSAQTNAQRIEELKRLLAESDYKTLKYVEGAIDGDEFEAACAERAAMRSEINRLEAELQNEE